MGLGAPILEGFHPARSEPPIEMNQIRYFLAVCEHRNFTHAARASNVSHTKER